MAVDIMYERSTLPILVFCVSMVDSDEEMISLSAESPEVAVEGWKPSVSLLITMLGSPSSKPSAGGGGEAKDDADEEEDRPKYIYDEEEEVSAEEAESLLRLLENEAEELLCVRWERWSKKGSERWSESE
jgi:hypothetical protein